ncbi:PAS domain-containing hybrid sensor histidine kinase/response regulator [Sulfitobacter sp. CW3]|uniref:hybrid sensor histidine kinase/response regulator n=1 Tax=Sulfitobacter sp. CW3 TaxID=2861965 RepID=UPI00215182D7|nr:PAS domain-containing hybrid sensor histidine kinase/response regulator [Sulfitobacter sp. CW3]
MRLRLVLSVLLGAIGIAAIVYLSIYVARDLRLLNSASSDNVQWTLSQAEVEFVEFQLHLATLDVNSPTDIKQLRRDYDIFFSRIRTLKQSSLYAGLRAQVEYSSSLSAVESFLDQTVDMIDADDVGLIAALPALREQATDIRISVRRLSNSGLNFFARDSDLRRKRIAVTLSQMAFGVTALLVALLLLSVFLGVLNRQNIRRRSEVIEASSRMKVVTGTALDAVIVANAEGNILDFNTAAEQIFGYTVQEALGQELGAMIVPDQYRHAHETGMQRMRDKGEKRVVGKGRVKLEAKRKSGDVFPVELAVQSATTSEGEIYIAFLRDISTQVEAERELVMARDRAMAGEKAKTDFLATMSHEIRTPLNGLLGNLTLLAETKLSTKQARYIKNMDTSGKLLMSHISDVLDITKYDAGKLRLRPVAMDISLLLQDIVDNQSGAASANGTTLEWSWITTPVNWICADRDRIQHILMNVIGNAVKFTRDGRIVIQVEMEEHKGQAPALQITVSDTGIGMTEELQEQIFDDFMTGDSSYDRDVGGTGLGLGIAQRFVKALGGSIDVSSTVGQGSTFSICFPIEPINAPDPQIALRKPAAQAKHSAILLVEDNEINRVVAREMLIAAGHYVTEAHNGSVAVDIAQVTRFDLILMDISMPVLDGRGATRAIRAGKGVNAKTPIVALTANAMADEQEAFLSDGMNDILTKPLVRNDLLTVITQYAQPQAGAEKPVDTASATVATQYLDDLRDTLGVDRLKTLLERYAQEIDQGIVALSDPAQNTLPEISALAHRLAGSSASMGAMEMRAAFLAIEASAKIEDKARTDRCIAELPDVWARTRPLLQAERRVSPRDGIDN